MISSTFLVRMEPGTGSPVVERFFSVSLLLLLVGIVLVLARTAFLMSLLWIMPFARLFSFVPWIRRWIDRKTAGHRSTRSTTTGR